METPTAIRSAPSRALAREPAPTLTRPKLAAAPSQPPVRIYRSATLRPEEWHDIVAKGRGG